CFHVATSAPAGLTGRRRVPVPDAGDGLAPAGSLTSRTTPSANHGPLFHGRPGWPSGRSVPHPSAGRRARPPSLTTSPDGGAEMTMTMAALALLAGLSLALPPAAADDQRPGGNQSKTAGKALPAQ